MPHVFIILLFIMLFVVVLSYLVPSGTYQRLQDASGITVIDPNTFQYVENETPIGLMDYFEAIYTGFVNGATIMGTLFISSGAIYLLEVNGAFGAGINLILKKTRGKEFSVVCIFTRFSWYSAFWDMARLPIPFTRWRSRSALPWAMTEW